MRRTIAVLIGRACAASRVVALVTVVMLCRVAAAQECVGDCDGDQRVAVHELVLAVNIALGLRSAATCPGLGNGQAAVDVTRLMTAVNSALLGCAPPPARSATPVPSAASTPTGPIVTPTVTPTPTEEALNPQQACAALNGSTLGGATVQSADLIAASPASPEYCQVLGVIPPRLNFEIQLPTVWSGRALFLGGFGLNGVIPPPQLLLFNPGIADAGYVTIGTDSGHQASFSDGSWGLDDPQAVENFAYLATHTVLGAARAIIVARYHCPADHTYFYGLSQGGREGLIAAQRWPDDFDGIVSLEPVYDLTALVLAMNRVAQHVFTAADGRLSEAKVATLARAELDACDTLDSVADGIIGNVAACRFDPSVLRCSAGDSDHCLSDEQIATVNSVHDKLTLDFALAHEVRSYPGWPLGHEDSPTAWPYWTTGSSADPSTSVGFTLSDQVLRFLVAHDPALDSLHFVPAAHAAELMAFSQLVDATDPDLSAFAARGGKLILWHGLADYAVSARSTMRYYERVVGTLGDQAAADQFIRFYTSPAVGHLNDGPGNGTIDFLGALTGWVETGAAPTDLIATKPGPTSNPASVTHLVCRYPTYPHYTGAGDPSDASSFHCLRPDAPANRAG